VSIHLFIYNAVSNAQIAYGRIRYGWIVMNFESGGGGVEERSCGTLLAKYYLNICSDRKGNYKAYEEDFRVPAYCDLYTGSHHSL
jgi:hypothetical protein